MLVVMMSFEAHVRGGAFGGKVKAHRYYLSDHGFYREVSANVYRTSLTLDVVAFGTFPSLFCVPFFRRRIELREQRPKGKRGGRRVPAE